LDEILIVSFATDLTINSGRDHLKNSVAPHATFSAGPDSPLGRHHAINPFVTKKTLSLIAGVVVLGSLSGNAVAETPGEETIQKCTQVLAANPQDANAYAERAKAYFIAHDCEEALRDFSKAITINDSDASYYGGRGDAYRALRQPAAPVRSRRTGPGGETAFHEYVFGAPKPGDGPVRALGGFGGN
jgi:tetratricopeptide (TPR) repeat protein